MKRKGKGLLSPIKKLRHRLKKINIFLCVLKMSKVVQIHGSSHRNSCKGNDPGVGVAGRGLDKVEGVDFETGVLCEG